MSTASIKRTIALRFPSHASRFVIPALCLVLSAHSAEGATPGGSSLPRDATAPPSAVNRSIISEGEDLLYEVRWTVFKIGTVRLKTLQTKHESGRLYYTAVAFIDSYEGLPFVNLHAIVYTEMDSAFTSYSCRSLEKKNGEWWGLSYSYDSTRQHCFVEETWQTDLATPPYKRRMRDTITIGGGQVQDGLSLLYFARSCAHLRNTTLSVPVVAYGKVGSAEFDFGKDFSDESAKAFSTPVHVTGFDGVLNIEGLFGLTGDFMGWMSDDPAAVPIKASLKVILGSVTIELMESHRLGWDPPRK